LSHEAVRSGFGNPLEYINSLKPPAPFKLGKDDRLLDGGSLKELVGSAPDKPKPTGHIQDYEYAKAGGYQGGFNDWLLEQGKARGTNVSVNTGQKGFDNTLKLRSDFRSEPIYKAHQEMQSAYSQITQSLQKGSPAGDLAGATKFMKILDPGSVVRESELYLAMQANGLLDRVTNYAEKIIKGTKLTPEQRKDFQSLADSLYAESVNQYNTKRTEYKGIADRNGLSEADVLGSPSKQPRTVKRTGTLGGRKVVEYSDGTIEYSN
jgi:hypothetical protein